MAGAHFPVRGAQADLFGFNSPGRGEDAEDKFKKSYKSQPPPPPSPQARSPTNSLDFNHRHASAICVSKLERVGFQPSNARARLASPIKTGGSPGRRAAILTRMVRSQTIPAVATTSLTE